MTNGILEAYAAGESVHRIARRLNIGDERVRRILVNRGVSLRTPREARLLRSSKSDAPPRYLPSPEEIAEKAAEVRRMWSFKERIRRRVVLRELCGDPKTWDTSRRLNGNAIPRL